MADKRLRILALCGSLAAGAAPWAGAYCSTVVNVTTLTGFQTAVNGIPPTLAGPGDYCLVLGNGVYNENVTIQNINTAGYRIIVTTAAGSLPLLRNSGSVAPMTIINASVTLQGFAIGPIGGAVPYGVRVSSPFVTLSSMTVSETGALLGPGVQLSSNDAVSFSSFSVQNVPALSVVGSSNVVSNVTANTSAAAVPAVSFAAGASSNVFSSSFLLSGPNAAVVFAAGASNNWISQSTITANNGLTPAVDFAGSSNTIAQSYVLNPPGNAAFFHNNAASNTVSQSWLLSGGSTAAVLMSGASGNAINQSTIQSQSSQWAALWINAAASNTIAGSVITSFLSSGAVVDGGAGGSVFSGDVISALGSGGGYAFFANGVSSLTVTQSFLSNNANSAFGAFRIFGSNGASISFSTITDVSATANLAGVKVDQSSGVVISGSYLSSLNGDAAAFNVFSGSDTITQSVLWSNSPGGPTVSFNGSTNTITQSFVTNASNADAIDFNGGNGNFISLSTMSAGLSALYINSASNTITQSFIYSSGAKALFVDSGGGANRISLSTVLGGNGFPAMYFNGGSTNTISQMTVVNPNGTGIYFDAGSNSNVVSQSTVTAASVPAYAGIYINAASGNAVTSSYVAGPNGVVVANSTGTTVSSNTLVALNNGNNAGMVVQAGNVGVTVASNTILGPVNVADIGVLVDPSNSGTILIASNTISRGLLYGIYLSGAQNPGTVLMVSSNTIIPSVFPNADAYGIYLTGLPGGATIYNNSIYYRAPSPGGNQHYYGLYSSGVGGLVVLHNRISNPGMIGQGWYEAMVLNSDTNDVVKFNDLYAASGGAAQNGSTLLQLVGATGVVIKDNIFFNNIAAPGNANFAVLNIDQGSQAGYVSNFNDYFAPAGSDGSVWAGAYYLMPGPNLWTTSAGSWGSASGNDNLSLTLDPLWNNPASPGAEDFHPKSRAGRFSPALQAFVMGDTTTSQTIDSADGADTFSIEPAPNGGRANQGSYGNTPEASKTFQHLEIYLPGESAVSYTPTLRTGVPQIAKNTPFNVTVCEGNQNQASTCSGINDFVSLTTTTAIASNFNPANLQAMFGGSGIPFGPMAFYQIGNNLTLVADDATNPGTAPGVPPTATSIYSDTSTVFKVYDVTTASPTVSVGIPLNATLASLGGGISGTAADSIAVFSVKVAIASVTVNAPDVFYDWTLPASAANFKLTAPQYAVAMVGTPNGAATNWTMNLPDSVMKNTTQYYVRAVAFNSSGNQGVAETTFTFNSQALVAGSSGDGQGSASVSVFDGSLNPTFAGCQPLIATVTFTVGAAGIAPGGVIAVRVPDGWTRPAAMSPVNPPIQVGYAYVASTTSFQPPALNPPSVGSSVLGDNWIVYTAQQAMTPGQKIFITYKGFDSGAPRPFDGTIAGPRTFGSETFGLMVQGSASGNLRPISVPPGIFLGPGPAAVLQFWPPDPLFLAPLQTSPTMYLLTTDACRAASAPAGPATVSLSASALGSADNSAVFSDAATRAALPSQRITIPISGVSSPFVMTTATAGVNFELLNATATLGAGNASAVRFLSLGSSVTLTGLSVDAGNPAQGAAAAVLPSNSFSNPVFISFSMSNPAAPWEVIISSSLTFYPPVFDRFGAGNPGRSLSWNGINDQVTPNQYAPPGTYHVRLVIGGGVTIDQSLTITVPPSASIYGSVTPTGPGYILQAVGPGTNYGNFAVPDANGNFQIYGLADGSAYNVVGTTEAWLGIHLVRLTTTANKVTASLAGTNMGVMSFPAPSFLAISASLPFPAPRDLTGDLTVHNADYSRVFTGTLHFAPGGVFSDSGDQAFGQQASTTSYVALPSDTYSVGLAVHDLNISTAVAGVFAPPQSTVNLALALPKKANVYGYAVLPAPTADGRFVTVQATLAGSNVSLFGHAFIPPTTNPAAPITSNTYAVYGLDPGVWAFSASAYQFAAASNTLTVSGAADVGTPVPNPPSPYPAVVGGNNLFLQTGGVIAGTVTVAGNTAALADGAVDGLGNPLPAGFYVYVNAYNAAASNRSFIAVRVPVSATYASSTFTLSGLADGSYFVTAHLNGFSDVNETVFVASGQGSAVIALVPNNAQAVLTVKLPGSPAAADFQRVAMMTASPGSAAAAAQDMTQGSAMDYFAASAAWHSPGLAPGITRFDAFNAQSGRFQSVTVPLANGATNAASVDLSGPTYGVSGSVSLAGEVTITTGAFSIAVSSIAGLLASVPTTSYCLLGQALPVTTPTFHMELVPVNPRTGDYLRGRFTPAPSSGAGCAQVVLPPLGPEEPDPLLGYVAGVNPSDGSFNFPNVSPGTYILRNTDRLDAQGQVGPALAQTAMAVNVSTYPVSVGTFKVDNGHSISGNVAAPAGGFIFATFVVSVLDSAGNVLRAAVLNFTPATTVPYGFDMLPNGEYAVVIKDLSYPPVYAARPVLVRLTGANQNGVNVNLLRAGLIKGHLALQEYLADGTTGPLQALTQDNCVFTLPEGFSIQARADPWFQGGLKSARGRACDANGCPPRFAGDFRILDANDQFVIDRLLPGVYDLQLFSRNQPGDLALGAGSIVSLVVPGVAVSESGTTDIGTVILTAGGDLRGHVYEAATSSAAPNVKLEARPSNRQQATQDSLTTRTDQNGNFELVGLNPKIRFYDIIAASRGGIEAPGAVLPPYRPKVIATVDITSVSFLNIGLDWAKRSVTGRVTVPAGGPPMLLPFGQAGNQAPGAAIFVQRVGEVPITNPLGDIEAVTDPNGNFNITTLATGTYRLNFSAINYGSLSVGVTISTQSADVGTLTLPYGAALSGALHKSDGSSPSQADIQSLVAVTPDLQSVLFASLKKDENTKTYTGYTISGFKTNAKYKLLILGPRDILAPAEAQNIVFASTSPMTLDVLYRQPGPSVLARAGRSGNSFTIQFQTSQPLRNKTDADNNLAAIITTVSAQGTLSQFSISDDRRKVAALYAPAVGESSFTLALSARSSVADPDSLDPANPEFVLYAQATFYIGVDGLSNNGISNFSGGNATIDGDPGRVTIPSGAFAVDASSSPTLTLQISSDTLAKVRSSGFRTTEEANIAALRYPPAAYPSHLLRAMAATPPQVNPLSAFYDILLPLGVRTALAQPVPLTIAYSSTTDPGTVNVYWYNAAANAYILQQDVTGAPPVIDTVNHTITINVNHFSTFVLFNTGVNVITGAVFAGGDLTVYNFPNPFDLSVKTINTIHPATAQTVRGTLINISVPPNFASGQGTLRIFDTIGERIRTIDLGFLNAGQVYYQAWDGRNDSGHDVANGVYIGQVKIGSTSKFFKMAVIK